MHPERNLPDRPSIPNADSLEHPASLECKQWIMVTGHVGDLHEWKTGAKLIPSLWFLWETRAGTATGNSAVNGVLSIAACAIYTQIYIQSRGYRAFDNSFNDRARQHGCNFQRNRDVCHFEELDHLERSPANHISLHFLIWNLTLPLIQATSPIYTDKQKPPHVYWMQSHS